MQDPEEQASASADLLFTVAKSRGVIIKVNMSFKGKAFFILLFSIFVFGFYVNGFGYSVYALDEIEKIEKKIAATKDELAEVNEAVNKISAQISNLSGSLSVTQENLNEVLSTINTVKEKLSQIEKNLNDKNLELLHKEDVRNATIRNLYKKGKISPLELLFTPSQNSSDVVGAAQRVVYYKKFLDEARATIYALNVEISQYEKDKKEAERLKSSLEQKQQELAALQEKLASQVKSAQSDLSSKQEEQVNLQNKLAELSAKQRELLAEKTGTFSTSVGNVPLADDPASRPDYNPGFSPAFSLFSFGAPHQKGMSQYGAYGRAKEGQNYEEILKAYYGDVEITEKDLPEEISTTVGTLNFEEDYLMGIAEMPSSWDDNDLAALKAQAIAARSYAYVHGKPICVDEGCQVYSASKSANTPENWVRAVEETKGLVIVSKQSGNVVNAWYASTSGGYNFSYSSVGHTTNGGWDTKCGGQNCWPNDAYENIAGSPWFYKAWYKTRGGATCGRSHPWLEEGEFADIVNALIIFTHSSEDQEHLTQVDANSCWDKGIEDIWDEDKVKSESERYGGGVSSVSAVDVSYSSGGYTDTVTIKTDKGSFEFDGDTFKYVFNLRAPGAIHLKSGLFNVEKK